MRAGNELRASTRQRQASQRMIESEENEKLCEEYWEEMDKSTMLVVTQYDSQNEPTEIIESQLLTVSICEATVTDYEAVSADFNNIFNDGVDIKSTPKHRNGENRYQRCYPTTKDQSYDARQEKDKNAELIKEIEELKIQKELNENCNECYHKVLEIGHLKSSQKKLSLEKTQKTKQIEELSEKLNKKEGGKNTTNEEAKKQKEENKKIKLEIQKKEGEIERLTKKVEELTEENVKTKEELRITKETEELLMEKIKKKEKEIEKEMNGVLAKHEEKAKNYGAEEASEDNKDTEQDKQAEDEEDKAEDEENKEDKEDKEDKEEEDKKKDKDEGIKKKCWGNIFITIL